MFEYPRGATPEGSAALEQLDALLEQVAQLADVGPGARTWSSGERAGALRRLDRVAGGLARVRSAVVVAEQGAPGGVGLGDRDFVAARARVARTGLGEARREVRQAQALAESPRWPTG